MAWSKKEKEKKRKENKKPTNQKKKKNNPEQKVSPCDYVPAAQQCGEREHITH